MIAAVLLLINAFIIWDGMYFKQTQTQRSESCSYPLNIPLRIALSQQQALLLCISPQWCFILVLPPDSGSWDSLCAGHVSNRVRGCDKFGCGGFNANRYIIVNCFMSFRNNLLCQTLEDMSDSMCRPSRRQLGSHQRMKLNSLLIIPSEAWAFK